MTERDMIERLRALGYRISRPRTTVPRGRKAMLDAHLNGAHRGSFEEACRACRFVRTVAQHRAHAFDVNGCALCLDRRTDYIFPSTLRTDAAYLVA